MASFNWSLQNNKIPQSWTEAIISVIPKQGRDKKHWGNYGPLSFLNVDYYIIVSLLHIQQLLFKRLTNFMTEMIEEDHTGSIGEKTWYYISNHWRRKKFDWVNWKSPYKALKQFRFSSKSIRYIMILFQQPLPDFK